MNIIKGLIIEGRQCEMNWVWNNETSGRERERERTSEQVSELEQKQINKESERPGRDGKGASRFEITVGPEKSHAKSVNQRAAAVAVMARFVSNQLASVGGVNSN